MRKGSETGVRVAYEHPPPSKRVAEQHRITTLKQVRTLNPHSARTSPRLTHISGGLKLDLFVQGPCQIPMTVFRRDPGRTTTSAQRASPEMHFTHLAPVVGWHRSEQTTQCTYHRLHLDIGGRMLLRVWGGT